ncbi:MAG: hypothetical protein GX921_09855 [Bacteroidales bacterium]|nr:hypothetical protein [Bacteroidales bacterium]
MALRQQQNLKQTQRLSPLQMQMIRLIELNSVELEDRIKQEMEENPALDEKIEDENNDEHKNSDDEYAEVLSEEELVKGDYSSEEDMPDFRLSARGSSHYEQPKADLVYSGDSSLHQSLLNQLKLRNLDERKQKIGQYIIGNLDQNGYLENTLQSISDDLIFQQNIDTSVDKIEEVLTEIQDLEPAGVGARNLQECLLLQINRKKKTPSRINAKLILEESFDEFTKKHYSKIEQQLNISRDELRDAVEAIISLNPKPGNIWSDSIEMAMANITPDFIVQVEGQDIMMWLNNRNIPELSVNRSFSEMMKGYVENRKSMSNENKQALVFVRHALTILHIPLHQFRKASIDIQLWYISIIEPHHYLLSLYPHYKIGRYIGHCHLYRVAPNIARFGIERKNCFYSIA